MGLFKLHYWPFLFGIWLLLTFTITYILSILNGHIYAYLPFLSDTGAVPPESCIFSQMLNIAAVIGGITTYIRYRQIDLILNYEDVKINRKWNDISFIFGICVNFGISIVGNFQEIHLLTIHLFGAFLTITIGSAYLFMQTVLSYYLRHVFSKYPKYGIKPCFLYFKAIFTLCCIILQCIVAMAVFILIVGFNPNENMITWPKERNGYTIHLIAAFGEWFIIIFFILSIILTTNEFKLMEYKEICFRYKHESFESIVT